MSPLKHTSLQFPSQFRLRSSSSPPIFTPTSFSVDRSTTTHTIYTITMLQPHLDGSCESKHKHKSHPATHSSSSSSSSSNHHSRTRRRFTNIFRSRTRSNVGVDTGTGMEDTPLQVISPRATSAEPSKRGTFPLKKRQSRKQSTPTPAPVVQKTEEVKPEIHIPATESPIQAAVRKDSVAMPNSPTKEMALHSHPVTKDDEEEDEKFVTPMSSRGPVLGEKL